MSRKLFIMLLAVTLIAASPAISAWKFVSIADSRGDTNGVNVTELTKIVNQINAENVDLVIFEADSVTGSSSDTTLGSMMDTWLSVMNTLNCPWYFTAGNHEVSTSTSENVLRSKMSMPTNGPAGDQEMTYSFDHQNAHFVALNSWRYGQSNHVDRSWLTTDLAATSQPHIFVYTHSPGYPVGPHAGDSLNQYASERDDLWNIMTNKGVRMFFCGHEHLYQRSLHGSIYQVINGTCGAPFHTGYAGTIAQYHYVVVTVDGNNVSATTKNDTGGVLDSWSYSIAPPTDVNCDSAKLAADGTYVRLSDKIVTCVRGSAIYVEEDTRPSAFRATGVSGVSVGDRVTITGTLQTNAAGEREILGSAVVLSSGNTVPKPLYMTNKTILGGSKGYNPGAPGAVGCNNSSMYIKTSGKVTKVGSGANAGMFYINDGSGIQDGTNWDGTPNLGVLVAWNGTVNVGDDKVVTGICSSFKNGTQVCRLIYSTDPIVLTSFTAFNDCVTNTSHRANAANVTTFNIGSGSPGPTSGMLKDLTTGANTGVTAALTQNTGVTSVVWQPDTTSGGDDCTAGTDAALIFNPTLSLQGVIYYGGTGWWVDVTFTGLTPAKSYEFVTTSNRKGGSRYLSRLTKYTISGADAFTNTSSAGTTTTTDSTTFSTGENTATGYVARWTNISSGTDGTFKVRAESAADTSYSFDAFKLVQLP